MDEQNALIFAHLMMGVSTIMPAVIMKLIDLDQPNKLVGYRTPWSMKSEGTWRYANTKSAGYILWSALVVVTVQIITYFLLDPVKSIMIAAGTLVLGITIAMILTERGLRAHFNKDGTPKNDLEDLF